MGEDILRPNGEGEDFWARHSFETQPQGGTGEPNPLGTAFPSLHFLVLGLKGHRVLPPSLGLKGYVPTILPSLEQEGVDMGKLSFLVGP